MITKDIFKYTPVTVPEGAFKISPSAIGRFFDYPRIWYEEEVLKQQSKFVASTSTVLGTTLHKIYESAFNNVPLKKEDLNKAILEFANEHSSLNIDTNLITGLYPAMAEVTLTEFIRPLKTKKVYVETEKAISLEIPNIPNVYVAGTADLIHGITVSDFKNVSVKPTNLENIPFNYKIQLLAYAWVLIQMGYVIEYIEVVYSVRPTKTLPTRCFVVREKITSRDWKMISDTLQLIGESVKMVQDNPSLTHLIFKSMDLKQEGCYSCKDSCVDCPRR